MIGEVLDKMPESCQDDVDDAVRSCQIAQSDWANRSTRQRGEVLQKAANIIKVTTLPTSVSLSTNIACLCK